MRLEAVIVTILFIIPGFIVSGVKHTFNVRVQNNAFDRTIESLFYSLFIYSIFVLVSTIKNIILPLFQLNFNGHEYNLLNGKVLIALWVIIVISIIMGLGIGRLSKSRCWMNIYKKVFSRNPYRSVWLEVHEREIPKTNGYICFQFCGSDQRYIGWVSKASDFDVEKEIYVKDLYLIDESDPENPEPLNVQGMILKYDKLDFVMTGIQWDGGNA